MDTILWYMIYDKFGVNGFLLAMCAGMVFMAVIFFVIWNRFRSFCNHLCCNCIGEGAIDAQARRRRASLRNCD